MKKYIWLWVGICAMSCGMAQRSQDFVFMPQIALQKKIVNGLTSQIFLRGFINENVTEVGYLVADLGLDYQITKRWNVEGHFRFGEVRNVRNLYEERYRFYIDMGYDIPLKKRFSANLRTRYQRQTYEGVTGDLYRKPQNFTRNRLTFNYQPNYYWEFYVSGESFHDLSKNFAISTLRTEEGCSYRFNQHHDIAAFYQQRYPVDARKIQQFVLGTSYRYKW